MRFQELRQYGRRIVRAEYYSAFQKQRTLVVLLGVDAVLDDFEAFPITPGPEKRHGVIHGRADVRPGKDETAVIFDVLNSEALRNSSAHAARALIRFSVATPETYIDRRRCLGA